MKVGDKIWTVWHDTATEETVLLIRPKQVVTESVSGLHVRTPGECFQSEAAALKNIIKLRQCREENARQLSQRGSRRSIYESRWSTTDP